MIVETNTKAKPVDVICQHSRDGSLTPIKIRVVDEDGVFQEYKIKGYRERSHQGTRMMPDGVYVTDKTFIFECNIEVFGHNKMIRLYYEPNSTIWKMTA